MEEFALFCQSVWYCGQRGVLVHVAETKEDLSGYKGNRNIERPWKVLHKKHLTFCTESRRNSKSALFMSFTTPVSIKLME